MPTHNQNSTTELPHSLSFASHRPRQRSYSRFKRGRRVKESSDRIGDNLSKMHSATREKAHTQSLNDEGGPCTTNINMISHSKSLNHRKGNHGTHAKHETRKCNMRQRESSPEVTAYIQLNLRQMEGHNNNIHSKRTPSEVVRCTNTACLHSS